MFRSGATAGRVSPRAPSLEVAVGPVNEPVRGSLRLAFSIAVAATIAPPSFAADRPAYRLIRYEEDWSALRDEALRTDFLDGLKFVPLDGAGRSFFSFGGDVRERYEYVDDPLWGDSPQDPNGYLLSRVHVNGDLHIGERLRFFGQLKSALVADRTGGARPTDEDEFDLHQAFGEFAPEDDGLSLRVGRQEMAFGSSRLVSVREGPNVRLSFDGARLSALFGSLRLDAFVTRPVETDPGVFDDGWDDGVAFWGAYATAPLPLLPDGRADLYYLGLERDDAEFDTGTADERRHSIGTRFFGRPQPFDYNIELVYQFGSFGDGDVRAWTVASDTGYSAGELLPLAPRFGLKANVASGDRDREDDDLETFNALFPRGSYFNEAALIGPANFFDLHPSVDLHPSDFVTLTLDWDFFWRQSLDDGLYGNAINPIVSGADSDERYVGSAPSVQVEWRVDPRVTFNAAYVHFFAGPFLEESGPGKDVDFVGAWVALRF